MMPVLIRPVPPMSEDSSTRILHWSMPYSRWIHRGYNICFLAVRHGGNCCTGSRDVADNLRKIGDGHHATGQG